MILRDSLYASSNNRHSPPSSSLLLIEHDLTRSPIPLLRHLISEALSAPSPGFNTNGPSRPTETVVLLSTFQHRADVLVQNIEKEVSSGKLIVFCDRFRNENTTGNTKHGVEVESMREAFMKAIHDRTPKSHRILFVLDSIDMMAFEWGHTRTLSLLFDLVEVLKSRNAPSRAVICASSLPLSPSPSFFQSFTSTSNNSLPFITSLLSPSFSSALTHLRLYPPQLFLHLSQTFLISLPNSKSSEDDGRVDNSKFYTVFSSFTRRERNEVERLVLQSGSTVREHESETVIEVVRRTSNMRKGVERSLEGIKAWNIGEGGLTICPLDQLESLQPCFKKRVVEGGMGLTVDGGDQNRSDPTRNLPFNLSLTEEQQASRAKVPLPYAHTGEGGSEMQKGDNKTDGQVGKQAVIYYDPDSADDMDDEDPDEDLDL
ncbi:hypothetical protein FS842_006224 [Serendipita sp. 407]|nr:hypothetical protein FS842_006224 [Serendipita sp. 407]